MKFLFILTNALILLIPNLLSARSLTNISNMNNVKSGDSQHSTNWAKRFSEDEAKRKKADEARRKKHKAEEDEKKKEDDATRRRRQKKKLSEQEQKVGGEQTEVPVEKKPDGA